MATSKPLRIAILMCDTPLYHTAATYGSYGGVFSSLLTSSASTLSSSPPLEITTWDVDKAEQYPDPQDVDAILLTGSRANAFDSVPWIVKLVEYVQHFLTLEDKKIIGVCFGHQIIGRALGLPVDRNERGWEVAVTPITLTSVGEKLFGEHLKMIETTIVREPSPEIQLTVSSSSSSDSGIDTSSPPTPAPEQIVRLQQMHRDHIAVLPQDLPEGVHNLGYTDTCPLQGLYKKDKFISVQGHPEFTEGIVGELLDKRLELGVFTKEMWEEASGRKGATHDGIAVGRAFLRFLIEG